MELKELKYFLAVAREETITKAAEYLYITQPSLTRQIQKMESEIGQPLFIRKGKKMVLTDAGSHLRKRAEEIIDLYNKAENEWLHFSDNVSGEIHIGGGESYAMSIIMDAIQQMRNDYPNIKVNIYSGDIADVCDKLDKGLLDFGILIQPADISKYESIQLPYFDNWGILINKNNPLAIKDYISPVDLTNIPLVVSRHSLAKSQLTNWYSGIKVNIIGTYDLINNATYFAIKNIGSVLCLDRLINVSEDSNIVYKPLNPPIKVQLDIVWKKYQFFSKAAQIFQKYLFSLLNNSSNNKY